ncbi:MAG: S8 family peptidase [Candidatus Marinimicrobia bacterium]|nr:S8 family peptidase [Candidatus Neomarinimicrobiota bacterium]MBL7029629.1 S8 family peptidase [Candidatus Neomarinimicrobiota bacterium]
MSVFLFGRADFDKYQFDRYPQKDGLVKAWIYFHDKGNSHLTLEKKKNIHLNQKTIGRRIKVGIYEPTWYDISVNDSYIERMIQTGVRIHHTSRWLNAVSVSATIHQLEKIAQMEIIKSIQPVNRYKKPIPTLEIVNNQSHQKNKTFGLDYGSSREQIEQIKVDKAHDAGFFGQGIRVLIMDTGFDTSHTVFDSLTIIAQKDFIDGDSVVKDEVDKDPNGQHNHGTYTWSTSGGYAPGELIGPAFKSEYLLAKTERIDEEIQQEEDDYVAGLEWGESLGADVVSTSLGYLDWYTWKDMDGNTAVTTKAVDIAVSLGMVCVTAAGNENGGNWNHIIAPADADSVIAVGAVDKNGIIASFSSRGPSYDGRIKPELCARGVYTYCARPGENSPYSYVSGTSLATPLVAGAAAVLLSAHPDWTPMMVRQALMMTASRWLAPDNNYGWGIIDVWAAINYDKFTTAVANEHYIPNVFSITRAYPNPFNPEINFNLNMGKAGDISLTILNLLGQPVAQIYKGEMTAGIHSFNWIPVNIPTGIFFINLDYGTGTEIKKITYLK